ncbi:MAG: low specificity L-threonine aldolase [Bacteroidetes bacterium]|nr:low specificity L-threonine aldolase [Bacteroidota bacterium]MCL2303267.1 low specificity L-threonine aldolase [Lentimicrobiaceae bacterium]
MRSFGSDNHSGIHPAVLEAIRQANVDHTCAYGDDVYSENLQKKVQEIFGENATIFPMFNGTGANICALRACVQPFHAILCPENGHIFVDECGAPEYLTGAALKAIPTKDGKVTVEMLEPFLHAFGFEHHSQPKVLYISQATELGTIYKPEEIKRLAQFLHQYKMYLHVDGARLANAAATLQCSLKEITADCGVDILSFGGTKNGMLMGESVITFCPELAENMKYIRKQSTQLFSKMRFTATQFLAYFQNNLWLINATHANNMAQLLRRKIEEIGNFEFTQPTEANTILVKLSPTLITEMLKHHFFYVWNEESHEIRLVTSWDTTEADIEGFIYTLKNILAHK